MIYVHKSLGESSLALEECRSPHTAGNTGESISYAVLPTHNLHGSKTRKNKKKKTRIDKKAQKEKAHGVAWLGSRSLTPRQGIRIDVSITLTLFRGHDAGLVFYPGIRKNRGNRTDAPSVLNNRFSIAELRATNPTHRKFVYAWAGVLYL